MKENFVRNKVYAFIKESRALADICPLHPQTGISVGSSFVTGIKFSTLTSLGASWDSIEKDSEVSIYNTEHIMKRMLIKSNEFFIKQNGEFRAHRN